MIKPKTSLAQILTAGILFVAAASIPAGRFGDPHEFGELCAFLCSVQGGYITGQNLLIDGGNFPGTM